MKTNDVLTKSANARPKPVSISAGRRPGFTLMEILIVIVIIAVIAAVLIPLVGRMKVSSQAATAIQRIRQCGMIVIQKAVDNNNKTGVDPMLNALGNNGGALVDYPRVVPIT